jgi:uncharacterized protein YjbJ (UPF0337 family)
MSMSEGAKEKAETKAKSRVKKAVAVVAIVFVALLVLSALGDVMDDACVKAGVLGGLVGKLKDFGGKVKEGLKTAGEKVKSAFEGMMGWLSGKFKASTPSTSTSTISTSTMTPTSTPSTPAQPVEEVKEPVILSVKAVPVKVSPKLFSDEVSSMENPKAIEVPEGFNWTWTDECAHSGRYSIKGRAFFWLKLPTNRSDFNLYDRLVFHMKIAVSEDVLKELEEVLVMFQARGWGPIFSFPLKEGDYSWPKWGICKVRLSRDGDWWRVEIYDIKWEGLDVHDKFGLSIVPLPPKLYNNVTFYVDDVQLYSSRSDACLLLVEVRVPFIIIKDGKKYYICPTSTTIKNLRTGEEGFSGMSLVDRELLMRNYGTTINEVYVPISVQKGDALEVTFSFTYYYSDGKHLYKDDALVFNRTVTVTVE